MKKIFIVLFSLFLFDLEGQIQLSVGVITQDNKILGSGFVFYSQNFVVTANHVLDAKESLYQFKSPILDSLFELEVMFRDEIDDIAILRSRTKITTVPILASNTFPSSGDVIIYSGYDARYNLITAFETTIENKTRVRINGNRINTSIMFYGNAIPGYSGGPIVNRNGELVGIITKRNSTPIFKSNYVLHVNIGFEQPILMAFQELLKSK
ncbi:MAG: trypsin-like peptidase domain-containing protein [Saprospiraceae bacterium]|nr:trypsin-like peptidase domain-containing protein [Saprospiraceae bacterium]